MAKKQADHSEKAQEGSKATPSKTEAVKEAIAQGITSPTEIVAHVKSTYGLVVTTNHVSMIKTALKKGTTGRKRGRPKGKTKKPVPEASATGPNTATPSKSEAVKEAIKQGMTSPALIAAHVKSTYGLDVTPNHVSMIKTALNRKGTDGNKPSRPTGKAKKPVPKASATGPDTATPSKSEAVREAMSKGITSPTAIAAHLKAAYGLDITTAHVSTIKGGLKNKKGTGKRGRPKGSTKKAVAKEVAPAKTASAAKGTGLTPMDLRLLSNLARQAGGIAQLREYLDVLGNVR